MSAGTYDIEIEKGATFNLDIDYKDSADALFDLTSNYTAKMYIRANSGGLLIDSNDPGEATNNKTHFLEHELSHSNGCTGIQGVCTLQSLLNPRTR